MIPTSLAAFSGRGGDHAYLGYGCAVISAWDRMKEASLMSRMENIDTGMVVENEIEEDADIALWNKMGRAAMFFCIWSAMAIPVLLIIAVR
jgi:hypothetical protein